MGLREENDKLKEVLVDLIQSLSGVEAKFDGDVDKIKQYANIVKNSFQAKYQLQSDHLNALDAVHDGIAIINDRNKFVYHNKAFKEFFSIDDSIIDQGWKALFPEGAPVPVLDMLRNASLSYPTFHELKLKSEESFQFYNVSFYPQENGNLLLTLNNNTESKLNMEQITSQSVLLHQANEIMLNTDLKFNVQYINTYGEKYFDEQPSDLKSIFDLSPEVIKAINQESSNSRGYTAEFKFVKDEEKKVVEVEVHRYKDSDFEKEGYQWIIRDITTRKRNIKALLESKRKAEKSSIVKQKFLANMTKDVRTPINSIISAHNLLKSSALNQKQESLISQIGMSAENLRITFEDILDLSDIQEGRLELLRAPESLYDFLNKRAIEFSNSVKDAGGKLESYFDEDLKEHQYLVDSPKFNQVLLNLFAYLKEHSGIDSSFTFKALITHKYRNRHEVTIELYSRNSKFDKKLIEAIQSTDIDVTKQIEKLGIGLTAAKQLLRTAGVGLTVLEHSAGYGFTFKNDFFFAEDDEERYTGIDLSNFNALYIDDNLLNQLMLKSLFENWRLNYDFLADGVDIIRKVRKFNPNIIFIHLNVSKGDATQIIQNIRNASIHVPIVALTNAVFDEERAAAIQAGVNDFLTVPIDEKSLLEQVLIYCYTKMEDLNLVIPSIQEPVGMNLGFGIEYLSDMGAGDESFTDEMLYTFIEQASLEIKKVIKLASKPDFEGLSSAAHKLQPSFILVDRRDLVNRWKEIEVLCKNGGIDENLADKLDKLIHDCKAVMEKVQDYLGEPMIQLPPFIAWKYFEFEKEDIDISLKRLEEVFEDNPAGMKSTLDILINQLTNQVGQIKDHVLNNDWEAIIMKIHNIQGSVNLVEANAMYQFGFVLEKYLEDEGNTNDQKADQVMRYLDSIQHLKDMVKSTAAFSD